MSLNIPWNALPLEEAFCGLMKRHHHVDFQDGRPPSAWHFSDAVANHVGADAAWTALAVQCGCPSILFLVIAPRFVC